jgi:hypothetical protein
MNSSYSGMKRSMPCVDLISLVSQNDFLSQNDTPRPFRSLDDKFENLPLKKRRLSPLEAKRSPVNPATEALDHFLRMSVDDLIPDFFDLEKEFPIKFHKITSCSFPRKEVASMHEVTCGVACIHMHPSK